MTLSPVSVIALCFLIVCIIVKYIIEPAFLSPLSKIPNAHWTSSFSPIWILSHTRQRRETAAIHEAHVRYGPIVRLAPDFVSVNSVDGGLRAIYGGSFEKNNWYRNVFNNYNIDPMFTMPDHATHSKRKRIVSNIYAKSTLQASPAVATMLKILLEDRMLPHLRRLAKAAHDIELFTLFSAVALDAITSYAFGIDAGRDCVSQPDMSVDWFLNYRIRQGYRFWGQELPAINALIERTWLRSLMVPTWVRKYNAGVENWVLDMCRSAEVKVLAAEKGDKTERPEDWPTVYAQLQNALKKENPSGGKDVDYDIASELLDHVAAGFDTSSITLTWLGYRLSQPENSNWQKRLQDDIRTLGDRRGAKEIDNLPALHAILMETLRLHPALIGGQPRKTPHGPTKLGAPGHAVENIPPNVRVQAQAWSLHREASVFPDPETWDPARWLDASPEKHSEMSRWFWAFGSGGRMCVGSNFAMLTMKAIIVALWGEFNTILINGEGMVHTMSYESPPAGKDGKYCIVRLETRSEL